jgi:glyoxylase-like metal-dependent hydrolase (beta-lactamase superfamily II)
MADRLQLDDISVHRLVELENPLPEAPYHPLTFFPNLTAEVLEENRAWLTGNGLDPVHGHVLLCFQSYILVTPHHTVLVDSCIGNDKERSDRPQWHLKSDDTYMLGLAVAGLSVDDIDFVLCTHLHADHVGWNTRLENGRWVPTFPNARYLFAQRELDHLTAQHKDSPPPYLIDSVLPILEANRADLVRSDHVLDDHIRLEPTPGHTPDHFAVHATGRSGASAMFTGDLIHSPLQTRYPDISMRRDWDPTVAAATRRKVLEYCCESGALMCTGHFPSPSIGSISRRGRGFDFHATLEPGNERSPASTGVSAASQS